MKIFQVRRTGMRGKRYCWWYPISSAQFIYGLITFLIMSDLCYLPLPDGFGVGVEARLPRRQRRPESGRRKADPNIHNRHDYQMGSRGGRHDYRNHRGGRWGRRRNDNESDSEIIPATEVFILEEQVTNMKGSGGDGGDGSSGSSSSDMGMAGKGANSDMMKEEDTGMAGSASSPAVNVTIEQVGTVETIGFIRGFLPGLTLGGGGRGKSGAGGGGGLFLGKGLFGGGGGGGGGNTNGDSGKGAGGGKVIFPEYPTGGYGGGSENAGWSGGNGGGNEAVVQNNGGGGWSSGQQGKETAGGGGGGGLFGGGGGGGGLFRNPFGGGGGKGRGPFRLLSKLNSDQPCAAGLADLPILNKIPFLPKNRRFPSFIPSGVNTCDKTCDAGPGCSEWRRVPPTQKEKEEMGDSSCTYNWRDSLTRFPFLLFRCHCKKAKCPQKTVRLSGLLRARCENVSEKKSRCKCPYGQQSYKCVLSFLPVAVPLISRTKPYYCTCCNDGEMGEPLGGYDGGGGGYGGNLGTTTTELAPASSLQVASGGYSGGYEGGGGGNVDGKTSASENVPKEFAQGKPLGFESIYEHLRRRF